jgi:hypothetical protein
LHISDAGEGWNRLFFTLPAAVGLMRVSVYDEAAAVVSDGVSSAREIPRSADSHVDAGADRARPARERTRCMVDGYVSWHRLSDFHS